MLRRFLTTTHSSRATVDGNIERLHMQVSKALRTTNTIIGLETCGLTASACLAVASMSPQAHWAYAAAGSYGFWFFALHGLFDIRRSECLKSLEEEVAELKRKTPVAPDVDSKTLEVLSQRWWELRQRALKENVTEY